MRIIISLLVLAAFAAAPAQEGWLVPFAAAYQPDLGSFNKRFTKYSIPEANTREYGWGIELRSLVNGLLVGPMFFRTWDDASNNSFQLRTEATCILGEVGLKIAPVKFLTIVPMVGAGGLNQSFSIRAQTGDLNLDTLLSEPGQNATISSGMKLAGLAALEIGLSVPATSGRYGLTLRGGYIYSPLSVTWHLSNGAKLKDTPNTKVGGLFFSAGILILPAPEMGSSTGGIH